VQAVVANPIWTSVRFYLNISLLLSPHTPAVPLLFYYNIYTYVRRMPPPEKSVQMIVALATYDSAPSSKWRAIVVIIYYKHYNDIIVYRVSVANRVHTHTHTHTACLELYNYYNIGNANSTKMSFGSPRGMKCTTSGARVISRVYQLSYTEQQQRQRIHLLRKGPRGCHRSGIIIMLMFFEFHQIHPFRITRAIMACKY